jgi:hypothetical protein
MPPEDDPPRGESDDDVAFPSPGLFGLLLSEASKPPRCALAERLLLLATAASTAIH